MQMQMEALRDGKIFVDAAVRDGMKFALQYRRKGSDAPWNNIEAFADEVFAHEFLARYEKQVEGWPWEYRLIEEG